MNRTRLAALATALGVAVPVLAASPALAAGPMRITKIHYGQSGTDLNTEYVVLKNTSTHTVNLHNWKIISAPSSDNQRYLFPTLKLQPGHTVVLHTGIGTNTHTDLYWDATSPRWDDAGDKAILKNASGTVIDTCQYAGGGTTAYC